MVIRRNDRRRLAIALPLVLACGCQPTFIDPRVPLSTARFALGQPDVTSDRNLQLGLLHPAGALLVGGKLYVADSGNNRVLAWDSFPTSQSTPPTLVLGEPDLVSSVPPGNGGGFFNPHRVSSDGTRLLVADQGNHRVLIWNSLPTRSLQPADVIVGQASAQGTLPNRGVGPTSTGLYYPDQAVSDGTRLFVADRYNNRVLIWNAIPTTNGVHADVVLGQTSMSSGAANVGGVVSDTTLSNPYSVAVSGSRLFVADTNNHRVLIWNTIPTVSGTKADIVLGQTSMSGGTAATTNAGLRSPENVLVIGSKLVVTDSGNNRVLIWNTIPADATGNGTPADVVLGQPNFTSLVANNGGVSATSLSLPLGAASDGTKLLVADAGNSRVLVWNAIPSSSSTPADGALGQPDVGSSLGNNPGVSAQSMNLPGDAFYDGTRLFVADSGHNRILVWNALPQSAGTAPDVVLGQADLVSSSPNAGGVGARSLSAPTSVFSDGIRLVVADRGNHRVLVWNRIPTISQSPADVVVGQPDMTSATANGGGIGPARLDDPRAVYVQGERLFVADTGNHRVLVWDSVPSANGAAASLVLGQTSFATAAQNAGGIGPATLASPAGLWTDGARLFIADTGNNRVLGWSTLPPASGAPADLVLGQPDFVSQAQNAGGNASGVSGPAHVTSDGTSLYVVDQNNHRILGWSAVPATSSQAADFALGQSTLAGADANAGGLSATSLCYPYAFQARGDVSVTADTYNYRVMVAISRPQPLESDLGGLFSRLVRWLVPGRRRR